MKLFFLSICSFISLAVCGQESVKDILDKHRAYLGGQEEISSVKTAQLTGQIVIHGMTIPVNIKLLQDKAVRIEADIMGAAVISAYANGIGWKQNPYNGMPDPKQVMHAEKEEIREQTNVSSPLVELSHDDSLLTLEGEEVVNGLKTYRLIYSNPEDGSETVFNLDAQNFGLVRSKRKKTVAMNQISEVETWYADPREFNGVKVYMQRVQKSGNDEIQRITLTDVAMDVTFDEKIFSFPAQVENTPVLTPATVAPEPRQVAP